ncbi:MAG: PEP-CTERM sorting domain-containing protein [Gammaproteobacteria bacterium]|jgi:hypothetical protein|nr:PEP-CTERM sorting domain-containing protein [Gammaproteobacteria bacterium]MBT4195405.1 PEP-CTERM sorting domain-containing protein [Gammaproteobacteria bacterium]MBT4448085.1 PEP-CTERM sorting domain-containing protein [Gammaproteobacteria bacterium]MBT4860401.1 PEP-CTERM sorting domain-containing protein [Gammaproteobacteria bacterium]MBT6700790.1 PEP-CTERM sorting domain-containing protein [Gammaproteobacteria bacterium]
MKNFNLKNINLKNILFVLLLGLGGQAQAGIIANGGTFGFGGFTWTTNYDNEFALDKTDPLYDPLFDAGNGTIDDIDTPLEQVTITGSDLFSGLFTSTQMTTTANAAGSVSFFWDYETFDFFDSNGDVSSDPFVSIINGVVTDITNPFGNITQNGLFEFKDLEIGDVFGFSIDTFFDDGGFATVDIRTDGIGFRPSPVPEPSIIALFSLGFVGLGLARTKRLSSQSLEK